jgi:nickel/cobalt exporter
MEDSIFLLALKSSFILGLIHGVNPCGHSWLVLAPFTAGSKNPFKVTSYTVSFILGTTLACLAIGATLGMLSTQIPASVSVFLENTITVTIIILGIILIIKPHMLHSHDHEHNHDHDHEHNHDHDHEHHHSHDHSHSHCHCKPDKKVKKGVIGLFVIGFVNMIIPCPTLAIMYSYAIESSSVYTSTAVFASYALSTGISIAAVIFAIYKVTSLMQKLQKPWIESAVMRSAGALTIVFGVITLFVE